MNSDYFDYTGGRLEVYSPNKEYAIDEIRFFTKDPEWFKFRDKWDFKDVSKKQLKEIEKTMSEKYHDIIE